MSQPKMSNKADKSAENVGCIGQMPPRLLACHHKFPNGEEFWTAQEERRLFAFDRPRHNTPYLSLQEHQQLLDQAAREAEERGFNAGIAHRSIPRGKVSVHGTDGCTNCETGRITIYAASRYCLECETSAARVSQEPLSVPEGEGG